VRPPSFARAARAAALAADDKKARDVKLYDVRRSSTFADYFIVATVDSGPQASAVAEAMELRVRAVSGTRVLRSDGGERAAWRVLDFGGLVVHLLTEPARAFYGLERLWESARALSWAEAPDAPRPSAGKTRP
jgi:ribosome-associated protein